MYRRSERRLANPAPTRARMSVNADCAATIVDSHDASLQHVRNPVKRIFHVEREILPSHHHSAADWLSPKPEMVSTFVCGDGGYHRRRRALGVALPSFSEPGRRWRATSSMWPQRVLPSPTVGLESLVGDSSSTSGFGLNQERAQRTGKYIADSSRGPGRYTG